jgi:hypothetical protein
MKNVHRNYDIDTTASRGKPELRLADAGRLEDVLRQYGCTAGPRGLVLPSGLSTKG